MRSNWAEKNKQVTNKRAKAFYRAIGTKNSAGVWGLGMGGGGGAPLGPFPILALRMP